MRLRQSVLLFLFALLVPAWDALRGPGSLDGASRAGLALLPWIGLATRPGSGSRGPARRRELGAFAAFLVPPLGLGIGLDLAAGHAAVDLARGVAASLVLLFLWSAASGFCAPGSRLAGFLWWCLVPGSAALWVALEWAPRTQASVSEGLPIWAAANPLVFTHAWSAAEGSGMPVPWGGWLIGLVVLLANHTGSRRAGSRAP